MLKTGDAQDLCALMLDTAADIAAFERDDSGAAEHIFLASQRFRAHPSFLPEDHDCEFWLRTHAACQILIDRVLFQYPVRPEELTNPHVQRLGLRATRFMGAIKAVDATTFTPLSGWLSGRYLPGNTAQLKSIYALEIQALMAIVTELFDSPAELFRVDRPTELVSVPSKRGKRARSC